MKEFRVFVSEIVGVADQMGHVMRRLARRIQRLLKPFTDRARSAIIVWLREANLLMGPPLGFKFERTLNQ